MTKHEAGNCARSAREVLGSGLLAFARIAVLCMPLLGADVANADTPGTTSVEQGRYLVAAGNCASCHTQDGGEAFAGGLAFDTPFGKLYSTNITPDPQTGIGKWSEQEFARALREGVRPNGEHLYPAFPYTSFTLISDADSAAIFAYLKSLPPVKYTAPDNELRFPYNQRWLLGPWQALYFQERRFMPDEKQSSQWNRGAYLVQGLGHCGACHTPRNFLGAEQSDLAMTGATYKDKVDGKVLDWSASNLTSAPSGLAAWSAEEIASYLKHGYSSRAGVFGAMNEVVLNSTRHLSEADIQAMAVYLKSLPAKDQGSSSEPEAEVLRAGELQYDVHCGTCHQPTGLGSDTTGPPLVGSAVALAADPASLINITLYGAQLPHTPPSPQWQARKWQVMDPFAHKLSDEEAAALLTYVRNSWGNKASEVTPEQVAKQR
jgi:mono/diheme cytochrome c family protein